MNSNISTVIEDQIHRENDILLRRLTTFSIFRLGDLESLIRFNGNTTREHLFGLLNWKKFSREGNKQKDTEKEKQKEIRYDVVVNGKDINDVPIEYSVKGLKSYELPVKGVYVHGKICPGFPYRVRYNGSQRYMFDGEPRYLESIGMGYGKRLTFSGDTLNHNESYFWSDSHPEGFAFSIVAVKKNEKFIIQNSQGDRIGVVIVNSVDDNQFEIATEVDNGAVTKKVSVKIECRINLYHKQAGLLDPHLTNMETISCTVVLTKPKRGKKAELVRIENVVLPQIDQCLLYKEN